MWIFKVQWDIVTYCTGTLSSSSDAYLTEDWFRESIPLVEKYFNRCVYFCKTKIYINIPTLESGLSPRGHPLTHTQPEEIRCLLIQSIQSFLTSAVLFILHDDLHLMLNCTAYTEVVLFISRLTVAFQHVAGAQNTLSRKCQQLHLYAATITIHTAISQRLLGWYLT